ncbi:hypothetical protein IT402_01770 [Candidatus Nomurabacteria bacterium]|nr:hypothetical protein [Candidatus Nomurabacteria bacterium]
MRILQFNYLHHALGSAISQLRDDKSKNFSKKLGIGESMYRMIESGNASFPMASIYPLIQIFPEIQFEKFAKLLVAAKSMNNCSEDECIKISSFLSEIDPDFSLIFDYWKNSGKDSKLKDVEIRRELGRKTLLYITKPFESKLIQLEDFVNKNPQIIDLLKKLHEGLIVLKTIE